MENFSLLHFFTQMYWSLIWRMRAYFLPYLT